MIKKRLLALSLHIDIYLTLSLLSLMLFGLYILYSASNQNSIILQQQLMHRSEPLEELPEQDWGYGEDAEGHDELT